MGAVCSIGAVTHVDDTKRGYKGIADGVEEVGERVSLLVSSFNLSKSPILDQMDAVLIRTGDSLLHVLEHRETLRRFEIRVTEVDLVPLGFNSGDTLEDCFDILKDAYEKGGDTQTRVRRTLSVATVAITQIRTCDEVLGEPKFAATAAADEATADRQPAADIATVSFEECDVLKVEVTEDIGRRSPLRYVLLLTECAMDEGSEDKCVVRRLKARVKQLEMEVKLLQSTSKVTLKTFGFAKPNLTFTGKWSIDVGPVLRKWSMKNECVFFSLCEDRCALLFRVHGYYKFEMRIRDHEEYLYVNSRYVVCSKKGSLVHTQRLKPGDRVYAKPAGDTFSKGTNLRVTRL